MAFDFKKEYKEFYLPKDKPEIVAPPAANYIAVRGRGDGADQRYDRGASAVEIRAGLRIQKAHAITTRRVHHHFHQRSSARIHSEGGRLARG